MRALTTFLLALAACSADPVAPDGSDAGMADAGVPDAGAPDAGLPAGCGPDVGALPSCHYLDVDVLLVQCDGDYRLLRRWVDPEDEDCAPWFSLLDAQCVDRATTITQAGCDGRCVWSASMSVSFLHCEQRNGYIRYVARLPDGTDDPACADTYEFAEGYFPSFEAWEETHPCP